MSIAFDQIRNAIDAAKPEDAQVSIQDPTFQLTRPKTTVHIVAEVTANNPHEFDYGGLLNSVGGRLTEGRIVGNIGDEAYDLMLSVNQRQ